MLVATSLQMVANYIRSCKQCQRVKPAPSSNAPLKPLPIPSDCWKSVSLDFMFGMPPDHHGRTGLVVFVDRLSKMVHLAPCSTKITGKETALLFLDHVYRLHGMPETIISDRDPRFTSGFWRHVFKLLGSTLHMSTADHPQTDGQTERVNRVVADVLRTVATPKEWSKQLPFVEFAINDSVHASTGETPFYINGLRHPRSPVSFVRSPSLSEGGPLTSLEASSETQNEVSVLQDNNSSLLATATHDRPLSGVIGKLDAKSASEAKRFVDERLAITRKVRDAMASAQDKQKQYADQHGRKNNERFSVGDKVLLSTSTLPKNAVSVLPGGTTKLLPRYIGPYTVVEEVGDLNYRLALPPYMKTHPVFYVGRLKRYVDPEEITYPHHSNASDGVDHASNGEDAEAKGKGKSNTSQQENPLCSARDLVNEEDCVVDARPSSQLVPKCRDDVSVGHNLDATSCGRLSTARSVSQLDSRVQSRDLRQQRSAPASAKSKRGPRKGVRSQNTYRAPPALTDAAGNQRLVVGRLVAHRRHQRKNQILVHWRGHPQSFDSWEPVDVLRVDVPGLVSAYEQEHQIQPLR